VAAVAYIDPGNFATNIQAGSEFGYQLVWVVVAANIAAIVIQTQIGEARSGQRSQPS
jgi:manganese transport protein